MRIAVTGGTGLIGLAICRKLVNQGAEVVAVTRDPSRARATLPEGVEAVPWPGGAEEAAPLGGIDAVVNAAAKLQHVRLIRFVLRGHDAIETDRRHQCAGLPQPGRRRSD